MVSSDGREVRLPLASQETPRELRCPECGRILFGPGLDRPYVVRRITCGTVHRIRWADNRVVEVASGGDVIVLDQGDG